MYLFDHIPIQRLPMGLSILDCLQRQIGKMKKQRRWIGSGISRLWVLLGMHQRRARLLAISATHVTTLCTYVVAL